MTDSNFGVPEEQSTAERAETFKDYDANNLPLDQLDTQRLEEEKTLSAQEKDPRLKEGGGGFAGVAKELESVVTGGIQDTASSIATFPERAIDMVSGEMQREKEEKGFYRPEFSPFTDYNNPIITHTWWGKLLRGVVHFGTMAAAIIPAAKVTAARTGISIAALGTNSLLRASAVGAASDLISKESDGHNALGMLRDRYGFIDTPLTTKDTDHPAWMKFKNIVEGMGIGLIFDSATYLLGKGGKSAADAVSSRNASIDEQTFRKGLQELRHNEFGASKNRPIAEPHQGAHMSEVPPAKAREQLKKTREDWGSEDGSTGSVTTPVMRQRVAEEGRMTEEIVDEVLKSLMSDTKYQETIADIKAGRQTMMDVFGDAIASHQRMTLGRNAADMTPEEFLEEMYRSSIKYDITDDAGNVVETIETWTTKNIVAGDLVVGTLLKQLRDNGIAGRELKDFVNLIDNDGPTKQIFDTMMTAMTEVKRARAWSSDSFRSIGAGKRGAAVEEAVLADMADTKDAILSILQIAKDDDNDDLLYAAFELFSSMKTVNNLDDFDAWARKMIRGGQIDPNGPNRTGALIRELEGMMVHSVLSGPKTPARAIMGTATATFLRPLSQFLGATARLPFTGDTRTVRASLASMNAMMQAIPESFHIFKTKLDSYWSGDVSSIKTRFSEFTRDDSNWELLRRWSEDSGRATAGDRALFAMANQARAWNNNSFLTYSTKLMAATDDSFKYILGRAKMREKAMLSAMDAQGKGLIPDINPALMSVYEEDFYRQVFDADGNIIDEATKFASKEVTLTQELTGFSKGLNDVFTANPWAKPFFLFARTGVNGLTLTAKHTPGFNFLVKEFNDIAFANIDNLAGLQKYGITTPQELINAKALQTGRLAMGSGLTSMAIWSWMSGNITGNGPVDRQTRQSWLDAGWKPRHIKIGDVWIDYSSIEPFNQTWSIICDIGDYSDLMGEQWTEEQFQKISLIIAQGVASKSYLQGMSLWVDAFGGQPGKWGQVGSSLINNTVPMSALRNDLGRLFSPHTRELDSSIGNAVRNRNLLTEHLAMEPLPVKYNILTGEPIKDWKFLVRLSKVFNPMGFALDGQPGEKLIFRSGYDLRLSTYSTPDGTDLSDHPQIRSAFQKAIGDLKPIRELNRLAKNPKIIASIEEMERDRDSGRRGTYEPRDYYHNRIIKQLFDRIKKQAWENIRTRTEILKIQADQSLKRDARLYKQYGTSAPTPQDFSELINMYK